MKNMSREPIIFRKPPKWATSPIQIKLIELPKMYRITTQEDVFALGHVIFEVQGAILKGSIFLYRNNLSEYLASATAQASGMSQEKVIEAVIWDVSFTVWATAAVKQDPTLLPTMQSFTVSLSEVLTTKEDRFPAFQY
jgi:hypothetical protein